MWESAVRFFNATFAEISRVQLFDRSMAIAAQLFTSLIPIMIAIGGMSGGSFEEDLTSALDLPADTTDQLRDVLAEPTAPIGVAGLLIALLLATSLSRTLGRMYATVWELPHGRVRPAIAFQWLAAVGAVVLAILVARFFERLVSGLPASAVWLFTGTLVSQTLLWVAVPYLLNSRRLTVEQLLPGAVLAALVWWAVSVVSGLYLPQAAQASAERYGSLGVALLYLGWLYLLSLTLVGTAVIGRKIYLSRLPQPEQPATSEEVVQDRPG